MPLGVKRSVMALPRLGIVLLAVSARQWIQPRSARFWGAGGSLVHIASYALDPPTL